MNPLICDQCNNNICEVDCAGLMDNALYDSHLENWCHGHGHEPLVEEKREYETCPACNGYTGSGCEACGDTGTVIKKPSPEQTERGTSCEKCAYTKCRCSLGKKFLEGFEDVCRAISLGWVEWQEKGLFSNGYSDGQEKMLDLIAQVEAKAEARGRVAGMADIGRKCLGAVEGEFDEEWWEDLWQNDRDNNEIVEHVIKTKKEAILTVLQDNGVDVTEAV